MKRTAKQAFYNTSKFDFQRLLDDPGQIGPKLIHYLPGFSKQAREILEHFGFEAHIEKLERSDLLYLNTPKGFLYGNLNNTSGAWGSPQCRPARMTLRPGLSEEPMHTGRRSSIARAGS